MADVVAVATLLAPCIACGKTDSVLLNINTGTDFDCTECNESFTLQDVENSIGGWVRILAWIKANPNQPTQLKE